MLETYLFRTGKANGYMLLKGICKAASKYFCSTGGFIA